MAELTDFDFYIAVNSNGSYRRLPTPSSYQWDMEDVSDKDAGRVLSGTMYKNKMGSVRGISLSWHNIDAITLNQILNLIKDEYIEVKFICPYYSPIFYTTSTFYVGNRTAALYNGRKMLWSGLSFKLIERDLIQ